MWWLLPLIALAGCGERKAPLPVFAKHCVQVGGSPEVTLRLLPPKAGVLRVIVEEQGISVTARLGTGADSWTANAASPADRIGRIAHIVATRSATPVTVALSSVDSPEIQGRACVSADLIETSDTVLIQAERAFSRAGEAAFARQWLEASDHYISAARIFERLELLPETVAARHAVAQLAHSRLDRERDSYALASALLGSLGPSDEPHRRGVLALLVAKTLLDGPKLDSEPEFARTRAWLERARTLLNATPDGMRERPRVDIIDGVRQYLGGQPENAHKLFAGAARECERLRDWHCYAQARQNIAAVSEERQDYAFAMQAYEDALRHTESGPASELAADIADNLGRLQRRMGLFSLSELSLRAAARLYAQHRDCDGMRRNVTSLGRLLVDVGSIADAFVLLDRAVSLDCAQLLASPTRNTRSPDPVVAEIPGEDRLRLDGGSLPASSFTTCSRPRSPDELTHEGKLAVFDALLSLNMAFFAEGDISSAGECVAAAEPYAGTLRTRLLQSNFTGTLLLSQNRIDSARREFEQTLKIADEVSLPDTSRHPGAAHLGIAQSALRLDQWPAARQHAFEALRTGSARADVSQVVESLRFLAASYQGSGDRIAAGRLLRLAARLMDQVPVAGLDAEKRVTYLATQHAVFAELMDLAIEGTQGNEEAAWRGFDVSEKGRARSLRQALGETLHDTAEQTVASGDEGYRALLENLARLAGEEGVGESPAGLIAAISALAPDDVAESELIDRTLVARNLSQIDATLVAYAMGRQNMYAFVIDRDQITVVPLGSHEAIARAAENLSSILRGPEVVQSRLRKTTEQLARLALWPLTSHITRERIVIVPDGALHTVPFALLPWSPESSDQLVVHRAETVLVPSATLIATPRSLRESAPDVTRFDLIGAPIFRTADWERECAAGVVKVSAGAPAAQQSFSSWMESLPSLPGAHAEVTAITQLLRTTRPEVAWSPGCVARRPRKHCSALRTRAVRCYTLRPMVTWMRTGPGCPRLP